MHARLDGRAWTAADLDRLAGVAPFTANSHRDRLVACWANTAGRQSGPTTYRRRIENCIRAGNTLFP
ncbi:hypothetical protein AB4Z54_51550 [Streptomyces sp. MCAF7]